MARNFPMSIRDNEWKFSEDIRVYCQEFVDEYRQISRDQNLTPTQKLHF